MDSVRQANADGVSVAFGCQIANVDQIESGAVGWLRPDAAADHFGIHAGAADVLSHLINNQDVAFRKRHARDHAAGHGKSFLLHRRDPFGKRGADDGHLMHLILNDRKPAKDFSGREYKRCHRPDHVLIPVFPTPTMRFLGAVALAQTDGDHLEQAAFDLPIEICVGLNSVDNENPVSRPRMAIHVNLEALGCFAQTVG